MTDIIEDTVSVQEVTADFTDTCVPAFQEIIDEAVAIMGSQYATIQKLYPDGRGNEKLRIVASHGFTPEAQKYWEWVYHYTGSSCGEALRTRRRVIIPDYRTCEFMRYAPTLPVFIEGGVLAAQTTPLFSQEGKMVGMMSTHWSNPHTPPKSHLDRFDVLAKRVAEMI